MCFNQLVCFTVYFLNYIIFNLQFDVKRPRAFYLKWFQALYKFLLLYYISTHFAGDSVTKVEMAASVCSKITTHKNSLLILFRHSSVHNENIHHNIQQRVK